MVSSRLCKNEGIGEGLADNGDQLAKVVTEFVNRCPDGTNPRYKKPIVARGARNAAMQYGIAILAYETAGSERVLDFP